MSTRGRSTGQPRSLRLGEREIGYTLQRSPRRRTIGLRIDSGGLRVSAPIWTSESEVEDVLHGHARWIVSKLRHWTGPAAAAHPRQREYHDGAELLWLGQPVPLRRVSGAAAIPRPVGPDTVVEMIPIAEDCENAEAAVAAWYMAQALPWFRRRVAVFAARLGVAPREIRLTSARGRWGSCTGKGVIRLNWRLMQASPLEIDYVVAHELAHLIELNHSAAFWNTVARIMPEWSAASDLLDARDRAYRAL